MKKIMMFTFVGMLSFSAFSQKGTTFSAGVDLAMPTGNLKTLSSFGFGASAKAHFGLNENSAITGSVGYLNFTGASVGGFTFPTTSAIPIKVGYRYSFSGGLYVEPQLGYSIWSNGSSISGLTYAPNVGYTTGNLDFALRYEATSVTGGTFSFLGLNASYKFGGK